MARLDDFSPSVRRALQRSMAQQDAERARRTGQGNPRAEATPYADGNVGAGSGTRNPASPVRSIRTECAAGHVHASRLEARVCDRLTRECAETGAMLHQQVTIRLVNLAPENGRTLRFTVDFVVVPSNGVRRYVEAKGRWRSRDYVLRRRAAESLLGVTFEEVSE